VDTEFGNRTATPSEFSRLTVADNAKPNLVGSKKLKADYLVVRAAGTITDVRTVRPPKKQRARRVAAQLYDSEI